MRGTAKVPVWKERGELNQEIILSRMWERLSQQNLVGEIKDTQPIIMNNQDRFLNTY